MDYSDGWSHRQKERLQQTADDIQAKIQSIEDLMPTKLISLGNPLPSISKFVNAARRLPFFTIPQVLTRKSSFPPIPGP